jgi:hypothetical protein
MHQVARARAAPQLTSIHLGDQLEEFALRIADPTMYFIDGLDQLVVISFIRLGHPDLTRSRGRRERKDIEHVFDCQAPDRNFLSERCHPVRPRVVADPLLRVGRAARQAPH